MSDDEKRNLLRALPKTENRGDDEPMEDMSYFELFVTQAGVLRQMRLSCEQLASTCKEADDSGLNSDLLRQGFENLESGFEELTEIADAIAVRLGEEQ